MTKTVKLTDVEHKSGAVKSRVWIYRLITFSIPFLFFVLLEAGLRIGGYGQSLSLFIDTPNSEHYMLARPDIIRRYFARNSEIPSVTMEASLFLKHKPKNAIRVIVQGGSTAAGFPYGFGASPAGMLDQRLKRTFPDRTVEVINTAMSAVNSYTLLDFADEIIKQKPDAVLIYAGHNEYLGILGVGSNYTAASSHAANLLFLKLRDFRIFQLVQNMLTGNSSLAPDNSDKQSTPRQKRTMMATVAKHRNIEKGSEIYALGLTQFRSNLNLLLEKYLNANIPVLISTIASNTKDQPPFSSKPLGTEDKQTIQRIFSGLNSRRSASEFSSDIKKLETRAVKERNADLHYQLGQIFELAGQMALAKTHYIEAKENDLLRFRAPKEINQIIKELAIKHQATLVDYQLNLVKSSPNGMIGNNFMLEHLHPNLQGYFILADSFYQQLKTNKLLATWKNPIETSQAWKERPILPSEEYAGFAKIIQLKSDYPFTEKPEKVILPKPADWQQDLGMQYFTKKIDWLTMLNKSYRGYLEQRNIPMLLKTSQIIAEAMPQNAAANYRVGLQLLQEGKPSYAGRFLARAVLEEPDNVTYMRALTKAKDASN